MGILNYSFADKRIVVTGAGRGLGRDIVEALCRREAKVFAVSKTQLKLDKLKLDFPSVTPICLDLSNWKETREAIQSIGTVHNLVNNAAVNLPAAFLKITSQQFDETIATNIKGMVNVSQIVAKDMIKRGEGGSIVTVSSISSKITFNKQGMYAASKAALDSLTRNMAIELGVHKIRVNSVNPGYFASDMSAPLMANPAGRLYQVITEYSPLRRLCNTEEIVNTTLFLLSDLSPGLTGQCVRVCTGLSTYISA